MAQSYTGWHGIMCPFSEHIVTLGLQSAGSAPVFGIPRPDSDKGPTYPGQTRLEKFKGYYRGYGTPFASWSNTILATLLRMATWRQCRLALKEIKIQQVSDHDHIITYSI